MGVSARITYYAINSNRDAVLLQKEEMDIAELTKPPAHCHYPFSLNFRFWFYGSAGYLLVVELKRGKR
jgi:hypothetical protein